MVLAYAVFDLHLPGCRGLKEKRMIVRSLKSRVRNQFEVSAAEVGSQDLLERAELAVAAVGPDQVPLDALLQNILSFVEQNLDGELLNYRNDLLNCGGRTVRKEQSRRSQRVADLVRAEISSLLLLEAHDPDVKTVTIT